MIWLLQITTFDISLVVHGTVAESDDFQKVKQDSDVSECIKRERAVFSQCVCGLMI